MTFGTPVYWLNLIEPFSFIHFLFIYFLCSSFFLFYCLHIINIVFMIQSMIHFSLFNFFTFTPTLNHWGVEKVNRNFCSFHSDFCTMKWRMKKISWSLNQTMMRTVDWKWKQFLKRDKHEVNDLPFVDDNGFLR